MKVHDETLVVDASHEQDVRGMLNAAANSYYVDSPFGYHANRVRELARKTNMVFDLGEVGLLRGVANLTLLRPEVTRALQRADQTGGSLAVGITALATGAHSDEVVATLEQFGLEEQSQRLANAGRTAGQILALTALPSPE